VLVANSNGKTDDLVVPKSPGMKYRHYAPASPVKIVYGGHQEFLKEISAAFVNGVSQVRPKLGNTISVKFNCCSVSR